MRPYQFIQARSVGLLAYATAIVAAGGVVCFDWEDSIQAASDAATRTLKQQQRALVRQLLATPGLALAHVALRLNAPSTPHYAADLRALAGIAGLHAVFVPKVEHPAQLHQVLQELPLPVQHVIPIIETAAGFTALAAILALADPRLGLVAFGHCDYNLSLGNFPFFHHDSSTYWAWIAALDAQLQAAGKHLLNSPVLQLADDPYFATVLQRLRQYPSAAGQLTLCLRHTQACATRPIAGQPLALRAAPAAESPQHLRRQFAQHQQAGRFFALDAQRRILSPHEYAAAGHQLCT